MRSSSDLDLSLFRPGFNKLSWEVEAKFSSDLRCWSLHDTEVALDVVLSSSTSWKQKKFKIYFTSNHFPLNSWKNTACNTFYVPLFPWKLRVVYEIGRHFDSCSFWLFSWNFADMFLSLPESKNTHFKKKVLMHSEHTVVKWRKIVEFYCPNPDNILRSAFLLPILPLEYSN